MATDASKRHSTRETTHKQDLEETISQIYALYDALFNLRLIEKLCRPISNSDRHLMLTDYHTKFSELHQKLQSLSNEAAAQSTANNKKKYEERDINLKNHIRKIESKYTELFRDGSFKHYNRVAKVHNLTNQLYLINIQVWASEVLNGSDQPKKCC